MSEQLGAMPGVARISFDHHNDPNRGLMVFTVHATVIDNLTAAQARAVVDRYLADTGGNTFSGYSSELDLDLGWNTFAIDSIAAPITNREQIVGQAGDWVTLRQTFPASTVTMRATVAHPAGAPVRQDAQRTNLARVDLAAGSNAATVADAAALVASRFAYLAAMNWTVSAGQQPAQIKFTRRTPTDAELHVWRALNADQRIPHVDVMRINGPVTPQVWISEKTTASHEVATALQLAARHLPMVATLPAPVLFSASDQLSGNIGGLGFARGPVSVTIGGCTPRDRLVYQPGPAERALINAYERCPQ